MNLRLDTETYRVLFEEMGPSLGLWRAAEIAALREQPISHPVIELGCGDGLVTSFVLNKVEVGFDPDERAVERARPRGLYRRLETVPIEEASIAAGSAATVISNSVLEHVPRLDHVLGAVRRILRPGGRLIFTVPTEALNHWLCLPWPAYARWRNRSYGHWNLWPLEAWKAVLERSGLELEREQTYLRRGLVWAWDALDVAQRASIARVRLFGQLWRRLPEWALDRMARAAARLDLSTVPPGGGRVIVARRI